MSATARIWSYHGGAGTTSDVTGSEVRHKQADNDTVDLNNPIPIPNSGTNYGYPKHFKLAFTTTPNSQISNLKWYADARAVTGDPATQWDGVTMWAGTTATYSQGVSGDASALRPAVTDVDNYTSGSPLTINSGVVLSNPSTGPGTQDYILAQMAVTAAAVSGAKVARQAYYRYDEI